MALKTPSTLNRTLSAQSAGKKMVKAARARTFVEGTDASSHADTVTFTDPEALAEARVSDGNAKSEPDTAQFRTASSGIQDRSGTPRHIGVGSFAEELAGGARGFSGNVSSASAKRSKPHAGKKAKASLVPKSSQIFDSRTPPSGRLKPQGVSTLKSLSEPVASCTPDDSLAPSLRIPATAAMASVMLSSGRAEGGGAPSRLAKNTDVELMPDHQATSAAVARSPRIAGVDDGEVGLSRRQPGAGGGAVERSPHRVASEEQEPPSPVGKLGRQLLANKQTWRDRSRSSSSSLRSRSSRSMSSSNSRSSFSRTSSASGASRGSRRRRRKSRRRRRRRPSRPRRERPHNRPPNREVAQEGTQVSVDKWSSMKSVRFDSSTRSKSRSRSHYDTERASYKRRGTAQGSRRFPESGVDPQSGMALEYGTEELIPEVGLQLSRRSARPAKQESLLMGVCRNLCCCLSPFLLIGGVCTIVWNERLTYCALRPHNEGFNEVKKVDCVTSGDQEDGLVMFSCAVDLKFGEGLQPTGDFYNQSYHGTGLIVKAEMYQCVESRSGSTYSYTREWATSWVDTSRFAGINSSSFTRQCGDAAVNPWWPGWIPASGTFQANVLRIGPYELPREFVGEVPLGEELVREFDPPNWRGWRRDGRYFTTRELRLGGNGPQELGDVRVSFFGTHGGNVYTVLGWKANATVRRHTVPAGRWSCPGYSLFNFQQGAASREELENAFQYELKYDPQWFYLYRVVGTFCLWVALTRFLISCKMVPELRVPYTNKNLGDHQESCSCMVMVLPAAMVCLSVASVLYMHTHPLYMLCMTSVASALCVGCCIYRLFLFLHRSVLSVAIDLQTE